MEETHISAERWPTTTKKRELGRACAAHFAARKDGNILRILLIHLRGLGPIPGRCCARGVNRASRVVSREDVDLEDSGKGDVLD